MDAVTTLQQDHARLRKQFVLLSAALEVAPESRFVLREMCFSLQRLLHEHTLREFHFLYMACREDLWQSANHASGVALLRGINELILSGWRTSASTVVVRIAQAIERLEAQLVEQERAIFPQLAQAMPPAVVGPEPVIASTMSVNEILQRYPQTQRCFEELHINRLQEGYDSVDELAWRHGLDVSQFVEYLRHAMGTPVS